MRLELAGARERIVTARHPQPSRAPSPRSINENPLS